MFHFEETKKYADEFAKVHDHITWSHLGIHLFTLKYEQLLAYQKPYFVDFIYHQIMNQPIKNLVHRGMQEYQKQYKTEEDRLWNFDEELTYEEKLKKIKKTILELKKQVIILYKKHTSNSISSPNRTQFQKPSSKASKNKGLKLNSNLSQNVREEIVDFIYQKLQGEYIDIPLENFKPIFNPWLPTDFTPIEWLGNVKDLAVLLHFLKIRSGYSLGIDILEYYHYLKNIELIFISKEFKINNDTLAAAAGKVYSPSKQQTILSILNGIKEILKKTEK